jgi:hypothetical protein
MHCMHHPLIPDPAVCSITLTILIPCTSFVDMHGLTFSLLDFGIGEFCGEIDNHCKLYVFFPLFEMSFCFRIFFSLFYSNDPYYLCSSINVLSTNWDGNLNYQFALYLSFTHCCCCLCSNIEEVIAKYAQLTPQERAKR